jgi:hypothetical protein
MPTTYQQIRLEGLAKGFDIDVEPAQHLSGPELDRWIDSAEDEWFLAAMQDMCSNRVPVPAGLASLPPVGGAL